jgi:hypothetical protein
MRNSSAQIALAAAGLCLGLGLLGCNKADEGLTQRLLEANDKVLACQKELAQAKGQMNGLKHQLAEAVAHPTTIPLQDPEVIQLVADLRGPAPSDKVDANGLDPKKASEIVMQGAKAMQACYERALKRNVALQGQHGIGLTLGITVRPSGDVREVNISPNVDKAMIECMRSTAVRWKFPSFAGSAVTIEQKLSLTPKT